MPVILMLKNPVFLKNLFLLMLKNSLSTTSFFSVSWTNFLKVIKQPIRRSLNLNGFVKKYPCYYDLIFFSPRHRLETRRLMYKKSNSCVYIVVVIYQLYPNNSVRVCPIKLKIDMLYHIDSYRMLHHNTFRNSVF